MQIITLPIKIAILPVQMAPTLTHQSLQTSVQLVQRVVLCAVQTPLVPNVVDYILYLITHVLQLVLPIKSQILMFA